MNFLLLANLKKSKFTNNLFSNHILIIALFVLLTGVFTYPSYLEFDSLIGDDFGDPEIPLNIFWWYDYNIKNPSEPFDFDWLFYHERQFYPLGAPIAGSANFNTFLSSPNLPITCMPIGRP